MRYVLVLIFVLCASAVVAEDSAFVYDDHGNRDPFWPLVSDNGSIISYETDFTITDLVLEGIMAGAEGQHVAIINGRIVKANDVLGSFVIIDVSPDVVILGKEDKKYEIRLKRGGK